MMPKVQEAIDIDKIAARYNNDGSALIQILLDIQKENRWLPRETLQQLARKLDLPLTQVYHVSTFYKAFNLMPKGKHLITVCSGTACQVRGAPRLVDRLAEILKIAPGQTTADMQFSLETVNCLGCCALGPVVMVDGEYYSKPTARALEQIVSAKAIQP